MANIDIERRPRSNSVPWILLLLGLAAVAAWLLMGRDVDLPGSHLDVPANVEVA